MDGSLSLTSVLFLLSPLDIKYYNYIATEVVQNEKYGTDCDVLSKV